MHIMLIISLLCVVGIIFFIIGYLSTGNIINFILLIICIVLFSISVVATLYETTDVFL